MASGRSGTVGQITFGFVETIHAAAESGADREALEFGTRALSQLLTRYGG